MSSRKYFAKSVAIVPKNYAIRIPDVDYEYEFCFDVILNDCLVLNTALKIVGKIMH